MKFLVDNSQMKAAESVCNKRYITYSEMMQNAGEALAEGVAGLSGGEKICVLCGSGNNGGDGFVAAESLIGRGKRVSVVLCCGEPKSEIAREKLSRLPGENVFSLADDRERCFELVKNASVAVDCVFGTGFHGDLPDNIAELFSAANKCPKRVSADVPSGVNSDTGEFDERCFRPQITYSFAALKKCVILPECRDIHGNLVLSDIGIPKDCFEEYLAEVTDETCARCLPKRLPTSHKGTFGRLLNIAGSVPFSGAAAMSTKAALRTGAGIVTLATPGSVVLALGGSLVESTFLPLSETEDGFVGAGAEEKLQDILPKLTAVSVGSGMGNSVNTRKMTKFVLKNADCPVIVDADGINSICGNINVLKQRTGITILTPHPMEFSRLCRLSVEEIMRDRRGTAKNFAKEYGVILVLKGANTIITDGERVVVNNSGSPALAKGGSGDVLCGVIASLTAQGIEPFRAAVCGVYVHGKAAELNAERIPEACVLAGDLIETLPMVLLPETSK